MRNFTGLLSIITLIIFSACQLSEPDFKELPSDYQTVSLLGDSLKSNPAPFPVELETRIDSLIQNAPNEAEKIIWETRLLGYKGEYRAAIDVLDEAIEGYPDYAALYRHRGHRYITLRAFDHAIEDFETAISLFKGQEDEIEQDGLPNALNSPTSSLQTNTWYHLGLAYYLTQDFEKARQAFGESIKLSNNNDMMVASIYWYYMTLRKMGNDVQAGKAIEPITVDFDLIENRDYHSLIMVFKGVFEEADIMLDENNELSNSTLGYGLGFWHHINDRQQRAEEIWQNVYDSNNWAPFGYIAAEAELARSN